MSIPRTHPRLDRLARLELLLRVLEPDVRVVQRPHDAVDVPANADKEGVVAQDLDRALDFFADSDVLDAEEGLREDRGLERELDK